MKKFLSTILAVVMVLSSMAMVVSADDTFVYETGKYYVGQTPYTSLSAAVTAAGEGGTVKVSGEIAFTTRLAVSANITLEGINNARIVAAESFGSTTSTTNWKALLNLNGNITVKNITFDGSEYGDDITASTDFVPLRCAEGNITLENVTITGSPRSLMIVGSSTTSATVTANGLYCDAELKTIENGAAYADVNIVNGTLNLNSGVVNGFICTDSGFSFDTWTTYSGTLTNTTTNNFTLRNKVGTFTYEYIASTLEHYVDSYAYAKESASSYVSSYTTAMTDSSNLEEVEDMYEYAVQKNDSALNAKFVTLLTDAVAICSDDDVKATLNGYIENLN